MRSLHQLWLEQQRVHEHGALREVCRHLFTLLVLGMIVVEAVQRGDAVSALVCTCAGALNLTAARAWLLLAARARRNRRRG
ncbi:hypothetical protein F0U59_26785 [Archangium gephyra]|nr:hypothetical protein F0U59_26785 [Archangium gephyra]